MLFVNELLIIFRLYQFCGFAPFRIPFDSKKSAQRNGFAKWSIYNGVLIIYLGSLVLHSIISYQSVIEKQGGQLLTYLNFLIASVGRILAVIIAAESIANRKQHIQFLKHFDDIDRIYCDELFVFINYKKMRRNALFWLFIWIIKSIILISLVFAEVLRADIIAWKKTMSFFLTVPLLISVLKYFQVIHYIQSLGYRFEMINEKLTDIYAKTNRLNLNEKRLSSSNNKEIDKSVDEVIYDEIVALRRIFYALWENTEQLNKTFRWSLLLLIATSFAIILVNYYRVLVWLLINREVEDLYTIIVYTFWSTGHAFYFIKLSKTCHHISQEVR